MVNFRLTFDDWRYYCAFNVFDRKQVRKFFLTFMVIFRTGDNHRIPLTISIFSGARRNRSVKWVIQVFNDYTDTANLITVFQIPSHTSGAKVKVFHYLKNMFSRSGIDRILTIYYSRYRSFRNVGLLSDFFNCNSRHRKLRFIIIRSISESKFFGLRKNSLPPILTLRL
ncbi:MAG: hypothetical protein BWX60_01003 [Candidatus Marinimicrobia bacterium ADurb.Bin030]|nr:MAG: hypothetical protein BWX60_01003 [Candidatus Marinimicrobia bacterium ADurb.Bin030]